MGGGGQTADGAASGQTRQSRARARTSAATTARRAARVTESRCHTWMRGLRCWLPMSIPFVRHAAFGPTVPPRYVLMAHAEVRSQAWKLWSFFPSDVTAEETTAIDAIVCDGLQLDCCGWSACVCGRPGGARRPCCGGAPCAVRE